MRVFVAVQIGEELRDRVKAAQEELRGRLKGASISWVGPQNFHFTLVFLGEQSPESVERVQSALEKAASQLKGFEASVGGWGAFPNTGRAKTLWIGLESSAEALKQTNNVVELCLQAAGFRGEERGFHAHLTIGRVKGPVRDLAEAFEAVDAKSLGVVRVNALSLMQSTLRPQGAEYSELKRLEFGPG
jgi:RNA 2',3'-cyclic 3'-phosphodiesterase